ncbi:unnamed protein product [Onchocerca flexuosa]|uniref:Transmembrane protein n=1 Tax=Onchocerca flexuosa TaxID=387005 RepID=A0A183HZ49_9BILA|nr:unnamed protein product [Onchocerca flexuosa]
MLSRIDVVLAVRMIDLSIHTIVVATEFDYAIWEFRVSVSGRILFLLAYFVWFVASNEGLNCVPDDLVGMEWMDRWM